MKDDAGLETTRAVREKISHEHGNDPRRLVEYYIGYQRRFAARLRMAPHLEAWSNEAAEPAAAPDAVSRRS